MRKKLYIGIFLKIYYVIFFRSDISKEEGFRNDSVRCNTKFWHRSIDQRRDQSSFFYNNIYIYIYLFLFIYLPLFIYLYIYIYTFADQSSSVENEESAFLRISEIRSSMQADFYSSKWTRCCSSQLTLYNNQFPADKFALIRFPTDFILVNCGASTELRWSWYLKPYTWISNRSLVTMSQDRTTTRTRLFERGNFVKTRRPQKIYLARSRISRFH